MKCLFELIKAALRLKAKYIRVRFSFILAFKKRGLGRLLDSN
jgi:hypothetical protein